MSELPQRRVALVTGGAQGIGAGIAAGLLGAGIAVAIVDRQHEKASQVAARLTVENNGANAVAICADISSEAGCRDAVAQVISTFGRLDILINNAAPARNRETLGTLSAADWTAHEEIVLQAPVNLTDACVPWLKGNGVVVNISSVVAASVAIDQCSWSYHVSKAGLNQLTRWLAGRLGEHGIRVNAVAPGLIDRDIGTKLTDNPIHRDIVTNVVPLKRAGVSADVAGAVLFLCSDQASYITGQVLEVDGGLGLLEVFGATLRAYKACQTAALEAASNGNAT